MRFLLTGITGQVGWELQRTLMTLGEVIPVGRAVPGSGLQVDLAEPKAIQQAIYDIKPDWIINPAAYTAVDKAETEADLAMTINGLAPGVMAEAAKQVGAAMIHYSTDYVFDGAKTTPYLEQDTTDPQNIYGQTKLAGEQAIQAAGVPHLILRTSWVYSLRGKNFLLTMLKLAQEREELSVVNDQIGAPTWSRMIAEATAQMVTQIGANPAKSLADRSGVYHLTARGQTSWHGFAKAIFELDPKRDQQRLKILNAIATAAYPTPAKRPAYSLLDQHKLSSTFNLVLPDWQDSLKLVLQD